MSYQIFNGHRYERDVRAATPCGIVFAVALSMHDLCLLPRGHRGPCRRSR